MMRQFLKKIADFFKIEYLNVHNRNVNADQMISKMLPHNSGRSCKVIEGHPLIILRLTSFMHKFENHA